MFEQVLNNWLWYTSAALFALLILQLVYYGWLRLTADRRTGPQARSVSPVMPTMPTHYPGSGSAAPEAPSPTETRSAKFVVLSGADGPGEITFPRQSFGIGRFYNPDQDILIALDEQSVSRRHVKIHKDTRSGAYFLTDTSSTYGTYIRRGEHFEPVGADQPVRIYNGDVVRIGNKVTVRCVLPGDSRAASTQV